MSMSWVKKVREKNDKKIIIIIIIIIINRKKSPLIALYASTSSSSSSRYLLRHVGLGSPFTPSLSNMLPMEIYTYLSYRRKINETDVSYTYNLQKVWDKQL